jgi:GNAT superfamily N-acetyltransferase
MVDGETEAGWRIRAGRDSDGTALIALIWACWSAYPGVRMDVDAEMPELHALATYYVAQGGVLWVAETDSAVLGMIAVRPLQGRTWEICRVYVDPALHGAGRGHALLDLAERHAITAGADRLVLWSDTRFDRAHRFYEKRSYVRHGAVRVLNDISNSLEFGYAKPVDGIEALDIAAAESAVGRLATILVGCVHDGGSVGFLKPLASRAARAFWQRAASGTGVGRSILLGAWRGGVLSGGGLLDLAMPETQGHRAGVRMVLVEPGARRMGLGRLLLRRLEAAALGDGRSLLTLETRAGGAGEALCRGEGWREAGRIPGFTRDAEGDSHPMVLCWKQIAD